MRKRVDFQNKKENKTGFIELKNMQDNSMELNFFGDINSEEWMNYSAEDRCPSDVLDLLNSIGNQNLNININSCGGSVFGGITIYNLIKQKCTGNITVNITGQAASIASVIAMAGNKINMGLGSQLMIHKPLCMAYGNATDFQSMIDVLDKCQESILDIYMANVNEGITRDEINQLINQESYLNAADCTRLFKNIGSMVGNNFTNSNSTKIVNTKVVEDPEENGPDENEVDDPDSSEPEDNNKEPDNKVNEEEKNKEQDIDNCLKELSIFLCEKL